MDSERPSNEALLTEIAGLRQEMAQLRRSNADLELQIEMLTEHSDGVTEVLHQTIEITQREGRERFEMVTNTVPVAVVISRVADDVMVYANESATHLFALAAAELLGQSVGGFYRRPQERQQILAAIAEEGLVNHWEIQGQRQDQTSFWTAAFIRPLNFDAAPCLLEVYYDLTARKEAEQALARFAGQLSTVADVAAQSSAILDPRQLLERVVTLIVARFNPQAVYVYILNQTNQELVLMAGSDPAGARSSEQGRRLSLLQDANPLVRAVRSKEIVLLDNRHQAAPRESSGLAECSEILAPLIARGQALGVVDIQAEPAHHFTQSDVDIYSTMAGQIATSWQNARLYTEAQQTAEQLREIDRIKGEFMATISHELQTPLNAILGYTQILLMGIDGELNTEMQEDMQAIESNSHHLLDLIHNILDMSKLEAGQMVLTVEDVRLAPVMEEVAAAQGDFLKEKPHIEFQVRMQSDELRVHADRLRLTQILQNLVSNAFKFTHQGHIYVTVFREDAWACIAVEDTGVGIAESDQERLFERFHQVDSTNARQAEGLGLGLAISRRLVMMQGGTLEVQSTLGQGSTFTVRLPLCETGNVLLSAAPAPLPECRAYP